MDKELLRYRAHLDQTRANVRSALRDIPPDQLAAMVRTCAKGDLSGFDEREQLLVGLLAIVSIFDLIEPPSEEATS